MTQTLIPNRAYRLNDFALPLALGDSLRMVNAEMTRTGAYTGDPSRSFCGLEPRLELTHAACSRSAANLSSAFRLGVAPGALRPYGAGPNEPGNALRGLLRPKAPRYTSCGDRAPDHTGRLALYIRRGLSAALDLLYHELSAKIEGMDENPEGPQESDAGDGRKRRQGGSGEDVQGAASGTRQKGRGGTRGQKETEVAPNLRRAA